MNKKGLTVLIIVLEVLAVALISFTTIGVAQSYGKSESVNKINLANEIKMMVDTLVATPYDTKVAFPGDLSKYVFILSNEKISVSLPGESDIKKEVRHFSLPDRFRAFGSMTEKNQLCLRKEGRDIILEECI